MKKVWILSILFILAGCEFITNAQTVTVLIPTQSPQTQRLNFIDQEGRFIEAPIYEDVTFVYWLDEDYRFLSELNRLNLDLLDSYPQYAVYQDALGRTILPNVLNMNQEQGKTVLETLGFGVLVFERQIQESTPDAIVDYGQFMIPGQVIQNNTTVTVIVSQPFPFPEFYDYIVEVPYDGPRLDVERLGRVDQAYALTNGAYRGTGYAFNVEYRPGRRNVGGGCIDGDTSIFQYPPEIFSRIESNAKSTRYFNVDTPETFSGGEEPFGFLATDYVCDVLERAQSIILQTDPGDNLLDRFGRFLAWIWVQMPGDEDYQLLNYNIVRRGLGEVQYLFGAGETPATVYQDMTYTEWMFFAQSQAEAEGLGIFGTSLDPYWDYELDRPLINP